VRVAKEWPAESQVAAQNRGAGFLENSRALMKFGGTMVRCGQPDYSCPQRFSGEVDAGFEMASNLLACLDEDSDDYDVGGWG